MTRLFLLLLCVCAMCAVSVTAQNLNISGVVIDEKEHSLAHCNVVFLNKSDSTFYKSTTTDNNGRFSITVEKNIYLFKIGFVGYQEYEAFVDIEQDTNLTPITLHAENQGIKEVTVVANLPTVVRYADRYVVSVENSPLLKNKSLYRILPLTPGVFVEPSGDITINGISGVTVIINNKTVRMSGEQLKAYLRTIQGAEIKTIAIIPNPTSHYEAQGVGGVIEIETRKRREDGVDGYIGV